MPAPIIGITMGRLPRESTSTFALGEAYVSSVLAAGGIPIVIPMGLDNDHQDGILAKIEGIIFSGGGDIEPDLYNAPPDPRAKSRDRNRDLVEIRLFREALQHRLPFFGICRGFQVVNVASGGSLYIDVHDDLPSAIKHDYYPGIPRDHYAHSVSIVKNSRLSAVLQCQNDSLFVNSLHHQGARQLGKGFVAAALAPDGLVEAIELPTVPFGMAVQWHPECLPQDRHMQNLFSAFVAACAEYSSSQRT